jgi:hypothetical protein
MGFAKINRITPQIEKKGGIMNNTTTAASTTASHQISPYPGEYFRTRDVGVSLNQYLEQVNSTYISSPSQLNNISSPLPIVPSSLKLNFQNDSIPNTPVSPESMYSIIPL